MISKLGIGNHVEMPNWSRTNRNRSVCCYAEQVVCRATASQGRVLLKRPRVAYRASTSTKQHNQGVSGNEGPGSEQDRAHMYTIVGSRNQMIGNFRTDFTTKLCRVDMRRSRRMDKTQNDPDDFSNICDCTRSSFANRMRLPLYQNISIVTYAGITCRSGKKYIAVWQW